MTISLPDPIKARVRQFASELCLDLNKAGFKCRGLYLDNELVKLLQDELRAGLSAAAWEQETARTNARHRYIAEHGLLTREEAKSKLGLALREWLVVERFNLILPVQLPEELIDENYKDSVHHAFYPPDIALTDQDRAVIGQHTYLNRTEAIARLRTSPHIFNKLRYSGKIQDVDGKYRQSDLDTLLDCPELFIHRRRQKQAA